jgi:hypothetical protein
VIIGALELGAEAERQSQENDERGVVDMMKFTLKNNNQTANPIVSLLRRFKIEQDPDAEVSYVREIATTSRKTFLGKQ